ncbi:hypothetical protein ALC57_12589 [Trachymyrmex cornetzi]|uniref:DNA-directed DNA polymerase n=1 Tax=Trachymyrmex cornetzi TaxID=471704 RepID=A0A151J0R7_9HYME|nr:hypothetical protein ALC57_12589 [Trachymyrmex cornetzi]
MLKRAVINVQSTDNACFAWSVVAALHPAQNVSHCHVCEKPFTPDDTRVRDHCHLTGRYRGPAHSNCNLNYRDSRCIPVVFHNLSGYDTHFIIKEINSSYLMYYDVNNLYGWAMCQPLPYADFRWVDDVHNFDFTTIVLDSQTGYILEVDLQYPQHLHDAHTDLPFCPTREKPPGKRDDKLLATLCDKQNYVIHYRNLRHSSWSPYRKDSPPIYVGMCILDISKTCLYEFHHEYMAPVFRAKCKIMYTDTDSLIYHVECDDIYDVMKRDINRFDTSDYAVDNAYSIPLANKKVPGLMKDENNGAIMTEFVGLRAKMYALSGQGKKDTKKAKDVKSSVVAKSITFEDYTYCLNDAIEMTRRQSCIRSKLHEVYTLSETKIALSPHDDKRYIVSGSTDTLLWGHYRCK